MSFGFCSLGISVEAVKAAAAAADLVIAQVNPQMPRTLGDSFLHVDDLDIIVEYDQPLLEVATIQNQMILPWLSHGMPFV